MAMIFDGPWRGIKENAICAQPDTLADRHGISLSQLPPYFIEKKPVSGQKTLPLQPIYHN
jgi:hypothetical protein